jgi:hypothetical protein
VGFPCWLLKREKKFHFSHSLIDFQWKEEMGFFVFVDKM